MSHSDGKVKLIFGLGNPGPRYSATRHNIGSLSLGALAVRNSINLSRENCHCTYGAGTVGGIKVILARPTVFMNTSGMAVSALMHHFAASPQDILILHDDMDIEFGFLKIKTRGGSAGHRGIMSIIEHLRTDDFMRIRVGIGKPPRGMDPREYVLQEFSATEKEMLDGVLNSAASCCETILTKGVPHAMNLFHRRLTDRKPSL